VFLNFIRVMAAVALLGAAAAHAQRPDPTAFGTRIELGDVAQARAWLRGGLDPDFLADRIGTGLMIAAWRGDMEMMALFVASGADVNRTNAVGETALMHAAWRGQRQAVEWLLARGARVDSGPGGWSALHYAAFSGNDDIVALLLERGASINARAPNGSTPLMMGAYEGHAEVVKRLLARGADTTLKNDRGEGALEWAVKFNHTRIARMVGSARDVAAAAAARPPGPEAVRSLPPPAQAPSVVQIDELMRMRQALAARSMTQAMERLDRRIASLRARQAREQARERSQMTLEITARRAVPTDQESRLLLTPPSGAR
jgi:ankyrin repeat protein